MEILGRYFLLLIYSLALTFADVPLCSDLGIHVTETTLDSSIFYISWWGDDSQTVFAQTTNFGLWRSTDGGSSWVDQKPKLQNEQISWLAKTANPNKIYLHGYGIDFALWRTNDGGNTYSALVNATNFNTGFVINFIISHPTKEDLALGGGWSKNCFYSNAPGFCHFDLFFTSDFGQSWTPIDTYVNQFVWGFTFESTEQPADNTISYYYTTYQDKTGDQSSKSLDSAILMRGDLIKQTKELVFSQVTAIFQSFDNSSIMFIAERDASDGGIKLIVSEDTGISWTRAAFPLAIPENSYSILDDSDGGVFVNIMHDSLANYGNVYASSGYENYFSLSLKYNRRGASSLPFWGGADFVKMADLDGIYVANYYDAGGGEISPADPLKSAISWDMGAEWHLLTPPLLDSNGNPLTPCQGCSLQLFGPLEYTYGRFYTAPGVIGIMLSQGNVGTELTTRIDQVSTYFTRDAGVTWYEIKKGSYTYEIGDLGSLLILSDLLAPTTNILFTWNEGITFTECQFTTNGAVDVENIVVDPLWSSEHFILYGSRRGSSQGLVVSLDFSDFHERQCQGQDTPNSPDSDYELWSPADALNANGCLLGRNVQYIRRKRQAECFNPSNIKSQVISQSCPCTREDYICDYCFELDQTTGNCMLACSGYDPNTPPSDCVDYYLASSGYQKVPGDTCDQKTGLDLTPKRVNCTGQITSSSDGQGKQTIGSGVVFAIIATLVLIAIVVGGLVGIYAVKRTKKPQVIYNLIEKLVEKGKKAPAERGSYSRLETDDIDSLDDSSASADFFETEGK